MNHLCFFLLLSLTLAFPAFAQVAKPISKQVGSEADVEANAEVDSETDAEAKTVTAAGALPPTTAETVQWYKPSVGISEVKNRSYVILSGQTLAKTKFRLSGDEVPVITKTGEVKTLKTKDVFKENFIAADERGTFELSMHLPFAVIQLPIEVRFPSGEVRNYQIAISVRKEDVAITNQKDVKKSPYSRRTWGIWGGLGVNYLKYEQETDDIPSSLTLQSFDGPSYYGKIARNLNQEWAFQATANQSPGKTTGSNAVRVSQGSYNWTFLSGEFSFFHPNWKFKYKKYFSEVGAQWGAQYHMVPFMARSSTTDPAVTSVETNEILMFAIGGTWLIHYDRYWLLETFMRYQAPYTTGTLYDIEAKFAFDGSVGLIYKWKPDWRLGAFWYGQWHKYKFSDHRDKYFAANGGGGPEIGGDQTLFFSNLEFRVGWEFD